MNSFNIWKISLKKYEKLTWFLGVISGIGKGVIGMFQRESVRMTTTRYEEYK